MTQLVKLITRPSRNGQRYTYCVEYKDENGKRVRQSLGHADKRKAEQQRAQLEREIRMGTVACGSLTLKEFLEDSLSRTRGQVRDSTLAQQSIAMRRLIKIVGNIQYQQISVRNVERFMQVSLDSGYSPATVNKDIRSLHRLFQLAVIRGQLEINPLRYVSRPKVPKKKVRVYSEQECARLVKSANLFSNKETLPWDILILTALCTGMRRGELLNATWSDVDCASQTITVSEKKDSKDTWAWHIKDDESRVLPLTEPLVNLMTALQVSRPAGYPYVFIPPNRYDLIQQRRKNHSWTTQNGCCPVNNFTRHFSVILNNAGIDQGQFHDLRRTCLTLWLKNGLKEYDVMRLAGHSDFETTRQFYLAVREDLVERARAVSVMSMSTNFGTHLARTHF